MSRNQRCLLHQGIPARVRRSPMPFKPPHQNLFHHGSHHLPSRRRNATAMETLHLQPTTISVHSRSSHNSGSATPDLHHHHLLTEPPHAIAAAFSASHITHLQQATPAQQRGGRAQQRRRQLRWMRTAAGADAHNNGGGSCGGPAQQRGRCAQQRRWTHTAATATCG